MKIKGYIALTTVLVILPVLLISGIDSLYKSTTYLIIGKETADYQLLKGNSETCIEEAVYKIKRSPEYVGIFNISMDNWSCSITISDKAGYIGTKIIKITAVDDNMTTFTTQKELNTKTNPFELSNI